MVSKKYTLTLQLYVTKQLYYNITNAGSIRLKRMCVHTNYPSHIVCIKSRTGEQIQ